MAAKDLALRIGALAVFLAVLAVSVQAAQMSFGRAPTVHASALELRLVDAAKLGLGGSNVTFGLVLENRGEEPLHVALGSSGLPVSFAPGEAVDLAPGASRGVFATVALPSGSAGPWRAVATASAGARVLTSLPLTIQAARGEPAREGDAVVADYAGRFPNGTLWGSSVRSVSEGPFPRWELFQAVGQPLNITLTDNFHIEGLWRGLLGLTEGQSKSLTLAPGEAFGSANQQADLPRTLEVERRSEDLPRVQDYPRAALGENLNASSAVGDLVELTDSNGNRNVFRLRALNATDVTLDWQITEGQALTFYRAWPRASIVTNVTNETVTLRTDPPQGSTFTWFPYLPNMTRVRSLNDTVIVLEHSPPVGFIFAVPNGNLVRVVELTQEDLRVGHPLGADTVVFDLTVRQLFRR